MTTELTTRTSGRRGVAATVTLRASELSDLKDELAAERAEARDFALRAHGIASAVREAVIIGNREHVIEQRAAELGYHASRFLRQRPEGSR